MPPNRSWPCCTAEATCPGLVTSSATASTRSGAVSARSATRVTSRAVTTALWPAPMTASARARPSPVEQPVMSQVDILPSPLEDFDDVVLQRLGIGSENRLDAVADLDDTRGTETLQTVLIHLALVGDLHAQARDARVDIHEVLPAAERRDHLLSLAV